MSTYPSGTALPAQSANMLNGIDPNLWYTDATGTFHFYLLGGMMTWAGIQDGIVCNEWPRNLSPPFKHLDLQAAQQDGTTWTATVFDPPEIMLPLEAHANTAQGISKVVSDWIAAWNPANNTVNPTQPLGTLEYFTLDRGYWYCNPRLSKVWQDQIKQSPRRHLCQKITHACRIDNAFWSSIPSTSTFDGVSSEVQTVTITGSPTGGTFTLTFGGNTTSGIAHSPTAATVQTALQGLASIGAGNVTVTGSTGGPFTVTFVGALGSTAQALMTASSSLTGGSSPHVTVAEVTAGGVAGGGNGAGFVPLTNHGDQDAWPAFLVYGPGVFQFGNGPGSTSMITFGTTADPILPGQVVLITTMPRLRSVVDLTPSTNAPPATTSAQTFLQQLIDLVTNNNVPPLLQWFESLFGIAPPQGNLYALLNGRFSVPIPGVPQPWMATESYIPVSITGGNSDSKIVASITPQRRWPE